MDELRHFLLIIEHRTLTAAARAAHLSQPALTASLQRLEAQLGARLFDRGRQGARLTAAGHALRPHAEAALTAVSDGARAVAEVANLTAGEVRLGAGATACTYLLPPLLAEFRAQYPGVTFSLVEGITDGLVRGVDSGALDLAIITGEQGERWRDDYLVLIEPPNGAEADAGFVTFRTGSPTRAVLAELFPEARVVMTLDGIAAVKGNVRAGSGVALVSEAAVRHDVATGRLKLRAHPALPHRRRLSLYHRGAERLAPAATALRRLLLEAD